MRFCPYCGEPINDDTLVTCTACGKSLEVSNEVPVKSEHSMKWFKFLIYFSLFASAVINLLGAVNLFSGNYYGEYSEQVYSVYDGLKAFDIFYGLILLGVAALAVVTRMKLAGYKADGPKFLYGLYIADLVMTLVYSVGVCVITGENVITAQVISGIVVSCVMIWVNYVYFNKRKALFCN